MNRMYRVLFFGLLFGVGVALAAETCAELFDKLDKNKDKTLSFEEFSAGEFCKLEHVKDLPFVDAEELNKKAGGKVTEEEFKRYLFEKADTKKDNKIDRQEWEEFFSRYVRPGGSGLEPAYLMA